MKLHYLISLCLLGSLMSSSVQAKRDADAEKTPQYWHDVARAELDEALKIQQQNMKVAKNVIMFLGDGMGVSTITAGRILKGQMRNESGEETKLAMEKFPHAGLSKTYSVDKQVADSASTATAYLCGVKSNYYTLGLSGAATIKNCASSKGNHVDSVLVDSYKKGKATGIVTTTSLTHATPGGAYSHTPYRKWRNDAKLTEEAKREGCKDIAQQFYDISDMVTVALAGGRSDFQANTIPDYEYPDKNGQRLDGQDLIEKWKKKMTDAGLRNQFVWNQEQFDEVDVATTDRLFGLFETDNMNYESKRSQDGAGEPSLAEMTEKAIQMLSKDEDGYFLLVEGGRIDHGHHASNAHLSLHEVVAFDDAIERAVEMTSDDDTLIIVTADHSHVFTMGGYSDRGNDIFGLAPSPTDPELAADNKPFTTLLYGNGAGYKGYWEVGPGGYNKPVINNDTMVRKDLTGVDTASIDYLQQTAVPLGSESHGGEDVAIFARGPMSHLIHGVHEQNYIAYVMRYVSCVGSDTGHCTGQSDTVRISYMGSEISLSAAESTLTTLAVLCIIMGLVILILLVGIWKLRRGICQTKSKKPTAEIQETATTLVEQA